MRMPFVCEEESVVLLRIRLPDGLPGGQKDRRFPSILAAKTADEKNTFQRQIDATDKEIDQLVYELYGPTDEEIQVAEETTGTT